MFSNRRSGSFQQALIHDVLVFTIPVFGICRYISSNYLFSAGQTLFNYYLLTAIILSIQKLKDGNGFVIFKPGFTSVLLVLLVAFGYYRTAMKSIQLLGVVSATNSVVTYVLIFILSRIVSTANVYLPIAIGKGVIFYLFINLFLFVIGVENSAISGLYTSKIENIFFISSYRVIMPLGTGMGGSALIGGYAVVSVIGFMAIKNKTFLRSLIRRPGALLVVICGFAVILLAGNRIVVLMVVVSFILAITKLYRSRKFIMACIVILFFFPFFYLSIVGIVYRAGLLDIFLKVSRGGGEDLYTLSNRVFIWMHALDHYMFSSSFLEQVIGYGYYGQTISGLVERYALFFEGRWAQTSHITLHNSFLQIAINYGIAGVVIYFAVVMKTVKKIYLYKGKGHSIAIFLLFGLLVDSAIEIDMVGISFPSLIFLFIVFFYDSEKKRIEYEPVA